MMTSAGGSRAGGDGGEDNRGWQQRDTNDEPPIAMSLSSWDPRERIIDEVLGLNMQLLNSF